LLRPPGLFPVLLGMTHPDSTAVFDHDLFCCGYKFGRGIFDWRCWAWPAQ
jgi:hypothetical protein